MKPYAFGVDIGGTTIKLGLFSTDGKLLDSWEIPTRTQEKGVHILPDIAAAVETKLAQKGLSQEDVEGVGMGVPGPVGADGTVFGCVNLGWNRFNVAQQFFRLSGLKTKVGNDANVAALGEMWQGGGKGFENVVMVTLGTGIGGGILIGGKILAGSHGAGGEIGHIHALDDEPEACGCGNHGCMEQYGSATGIVRLAKRCLAAHPDQATSLRDLPALTAKDVFDAAKAGDRVALTLVDQVGDLLGKCTATIAAVVDPQVFVVGGGVSKAGSILIDAMEKGYQKYAFPACRATSFKLAQLGNAAGIFGGCKMVLDG